MKEIWKDVLHYEGYYQVSNFGRVRAVERYVKSCRDGSERYAYGHIMPQFDNGHGYLFVNLYKDNKAKREYVHRLVALAFVPNPDNLPQVNHKDEVKSNNVPENLEWCDCKYNNNYGTRKERQIESYLRNGTNCTRVGKVDSNGNIIATYRSMREAERKNNLANGTIHAYFKYGFKECGGFQWIKINK